MHPDHRLGNSWRFIVGKSSDFARDSLAGVLASVVLIANIVSFGTLMFPGEFGAGVPIVIWSMLIGSCIGGMWIAWTTTLPPLATGIDSPTAAVLILLSVQAGASVLVGGGTPRAAIEAVMLIFSAATLFSGVVLYALGARRWGTHFRFVPYFVVGGFLAATGWFLVAGGLRITTGRMLDFGGLAAPWTANEVARLASAVAVLAVLLALRRWIKSPLAMPAALLLLWLTGALALRMLGLAGPEHGWYLRSVGTLIAWSPFEAARTSHLDGAMMARLLPEMLAVTLVALISLVTKVSSIEVARRASGDLNQEFRAHGIASIAAAPFGGLICSLQPGTSRLLEQAGGATRISGVMCALAIGAVGLTGFDLPGLIPIPIVAGLVFYLGYTFVLEAFGRPFSQRAWFDLVLAVGIMIACVQYGYLAGVLVGIVFACLLFAISYARVGVVRRQMTRAKFASNVDRSPEASEYLRERGTAIRLYWLSGYIFFGSSESVFERIRDDIEALPPGSVMFVIVDFGMVSGADSSAVISLTKLRDYCDRSGTTLAYSSLSPANRAILERDGLFRGKGRHRTFADLNLALAWCEDQLLAQVDLDAGTGLAGFLPWLQRQLGADAKADDLIAYFERKELEGTQVLYRAGDAADTIDFVAAGNLAIEIEEGEAMGVLRRRIMRHTVVGEMGFFRQSVRSATVSSDGSATLFTLTRPGFERMRMERPDLSNAFYEFIIRVLADRVEFSNREVAALSV